MNEILEYDYVLSLDDEKSVLVNTILLDFLGFYQEQNGLLTEEKKRKFCIKVLKMKNLVIKEVILKHIQNLKLKK